MTSIREYRVIAETMPVAKILWAGVFAVPWHQREFDWDPEHVEQFWDDIQRSIENDEEDYFIGGITLTKEDGRNFDIQDGQQRLTTYSMMVAALRDVLPDLYKANAQRVLYDIANDVVPTNVTAANLRIKHQESDRTKYAVIMRGGQLPPNDKLSRAKEILTQKANQLDEDLAGKLLQYLMDSVIANKTINGTENATQVFETLNDRGKKLNPVDLLRNFLYSHLKGDRNDLHHEVHTHLEDMKREAQDAKSDGHLIAYVQCALECRYGPIRKSYLYQDAKKAIEQEVADKGNENAEETVRELTAYLSNRNNIIAFKAVFSGDELSDEITKFTESAGEAAAHRNMRDYVRELKAYKVALPVTFAAVAKFLNATTANERRVIARAGHRIVQNLNALIMRTASAQPRFTPSTLEQPIARWGKEIMDGINRDSPNKIVNEITQNDREQIWNDGAFEDKMAELRFPRTKDANSKAKRLLYALYRHEQSDLPSDKSLTLEHVLPDSTQHLPGWNPPFDANNHERYAFALGNMTLLTASDNKGTESFNQSFENKRETLENSALRANRDIAGNDEWTPDVIGQRQRQLAKIACAVWKPHVAGRSIQGGQQT